MDAIRIWLQHPALGAGPGNYVLAQLLQRPHSAVDGLFLQAHNLPLHVLAVLGVAGVGAGGFLLAMITREAFRHWRTVAAQDRVLLAGYLSGLAGFLAWNVADVQMYSVPLWGTAVLLVVLILPRMALTESRGPHRHAGPYKIGRASCRERV